MIDEEPYRAIISGFSMLIFEHNNSNTVVITALYP